MKLLIVQFSHTSFSWTILMAYSKAKLKSSGDKASPCFRPFWIGKLSDRCLNLLKLLYLINNSYFVTYTYHVQRGTRDEINGF
jgi:hypothetical protein